MTRRGTFANARPAEDARADVTRCGTFFDDPEAVGRALTAPGVTTLVARSGDQIVGAVQVLGDRELNWVVGLLIVHPEHRRIGIGTALLRRAADATGAKRLDLLTEDDAPSFYRRFQGREMTGFRIYPNGLDELSRG